MIAKTSGKPFQIFYLFLPDLFLPILITHTVRELIPVKIDPNTRLPLPHLCLRSVTVLRYRIEAELLSQPHQPPMQSSHISQYALNGGAFGFQVRLISLPGSLPFQGVPNENSACVRIASVNHSS